MILGNKYISLVRDKAVGEGIVEAVRKYGNINVLQKDVGVASTRMGRACYLLVKSILEKVEKFSNICRASCGKKFC